MPDSKAKKEWMKKNTSFVGLKFNHNTDGDILEWLSSQKSKQGAVKTAIRFYLKKNFEKIEKNT